MLPILCLWDQFEFLQAMYVLSTIWAGQEGDYGMAIYEYVARIYPPLRKPAGRLCVSLAGDDRSPTRGGEHRVCISRMMFKTKAFLAPIRPLLGDSTRTARTGQRHPVRAVQLILNNE